MGATRLTLRQVENIRWRDPGGRRSSGRARRAVTFAAGTLAFALAGCNNVPSLMLGATTSTYDSGLLETLVGAFEARHPEVSVRTLVVGSGEALELGRRGDVDVLIVHAPAAEARFVNGGHSVRREPLMSNAFLIVGPEADPAGVEGTDPATALARIAAAGSGFVSRGDSSGTHEREMALWREAGVQPVRSWYIETGQSQGTSLQVASERGAYTLTDEATFTVLAEILDLAPLVREHPGLVNTYSVIVTSRAADPEGATLLADWLLSDESHRVIESFRGPVPQRQLFTPIGREATPRSP